MSVQSTTEQAASGLRIQRDTEIASAPEKSGISEHASLVAVHTPTPWRFCERGNMGSAIEAQTGRRQYIGDDGYRIIATYQGGCTSELYSVQEANRIANGELIIRAVNSHDALVALAKQVECEFSDAKYLHSVEGRLLVMARAALAAAKASEVSDDR